VAPSRTHEFELNAAGAIQYVSNRLGIAPEYVRATELSGGVSNHVVLVEASGVELVLKQSLGKLRVTEDWYADRSRVFREAEALRRVSKLLPPGSVPAVLFEDREQYAFAMDAAPPDALPWKTELMGGKVSTDIAERIGRMHSGLIAGSWESAEYREVFGDQTAFDQLRLDAYYRFTAKRHADYAAVFDEAIARCRTSAVSLVHGDWSPKNLLVSEAGVMAIDFEVIHFGDPAFDTAFLLNHLLLKSFYNPTKSSAYLAAASVYWNTTKAHVPDPSSLERGTLLHLPLLLLARIDGKSPAEYIRDPALKDAVRSFARGLMADRPQCIEEVFQRFE
jgi:5-methylthioribose kinase